MDTYGNYISGSYGLKYYKTILLKKEDPSSPYTNAVCIEIHEKDYDGANKEIGDLQNIRVTLQGDRDTIDSPIVKTSLSFTLVDTWDEPDTENVKHGNWQEFYTPDSTKFLVKLIFEEYNRSGDLVDSHPIWSGYVTPDSWQESLAYRGSITVTARDNIGHLQDFEFDLTPDSDGLVSIRDIITGAMQKVNLPLDFIINADTEDYSHGIYNEYEGINIIDTLVNASLFEGDDWYSVLEDVLEGLGFVLRFGWRNDVAVGPIRNLSHLSTTEGALPADDLELTFLGGGIRTIDPPYRSIREEMRYDYEAPNLDARRGIVWGGYEQVASRVNWQYQAGTITKDFNSPALLNTSSGTVGWLRDEVGNTPGFYDPKDRDYDEDAWKEAGENIVDDNLMLLASTINPISQGYLMRVHTTDLTILLSFGRMCATIDQDSAYFVPSQRRISSIVYAVQYMNSQSEVMYFDGEEWGDTYTSLEKTFSAEDGETLSLEIALPPCIELGQDGWLTLWVTRISTTQVRRLDQVTGIPELFGLYARLKELSVSSNQDNTASDTVTTINDESYNVLYTRRPALGVLSYDTGRVVPGSYQNILYYEDGGIIQPYPYNLTWDGAIGRRPLPVLIHMQLLTNHLEPMEILEGDCMAEGAIFPGRTYKYKGKRFLLVSGTFDPLAGRYMGATLREFQEYSDVWEGNNARTPATSTKRKTSRR